MILKDKVAVIYGAGGAIGSAVARAFSREGARLFLTGRELAAVDIVAKEAVSAGGMAGAAEVDALDEQAVESHLESMIDKVGRVARSTRSGSRIRRFSVCLWSSWMSTNSPCRS
jgi:NADP-dependent 3-hydroxy acid dehydrogenase YdfG